MVHCKQSQKKVLNDNKSFNVGIKKKETTIDLENPRLNCSLLKRKEK